MLAVDLSRENGVPETAKFCEKVSCNSTRPHVDLVLGGNGTGMRLMCADICIEEHASGVWFSLTSVVPFITF